ncbi:GNAT family N-acetyltransferase [Cellulomonas sp. KRMCY2]|uniref:GNAT family N-acetyltransferase n=1 Tax=Cellulomonas sp. KRMCY2 TaxID=1304865 RepID=UPI00045E99C0|nr:GNAT family N-acetyltransferase [Cellulomonas sp. KRMCY2]
MTTVCRLTEEGWESLRDLRLEALSEAPEAFGSSPARELGFKESHWRMRLRSTAWFVADDHGAQVGLVAGMPEPGAEPDDRHVLALWVRPTYRGHGVTADLLSAVASWARQDGARTLSLWVVQDNLAAQASYRRLGFEPSGVTMPLPRDPTRTEERWVRTLPDDAA